jgi:hypothetical protein
LAGTIGAAALRELATAYEAALAGADPASRWPDPSPMVRALEAALRAIGEMPKDAEP